jgi:flagellar biosynthesis protein FlhB
VKKPCTHASEVLIAQSLHFLLALVLRLLLLLLLLLILSSSFSQILQMKVVLQTYLMMCKLQRLKTTYTKEKLWVSKTSLDLLLLSTADRYAYNLSFSFC